MRISATITFLASFLVAGPAFGFGAHGHEAICEIAYRELATAAKAKVDALMAMETNPQIPTFRDACVWPDFREVATNLRRSEHFVNAPRTWETIPFNRCPGTERCVLSAIADDFAILRSDLASPAETLIALKFLGHWVGDIHQPLHVSFADDRGGNDILVEGVQGCSFNGETNLHSVWDTCIVGDVMQGLRAAGVAPDDDDREAFGVLLRGQITDVERAQWAAVTSPLDWANESLAIAWRPEVGYCIQKEGHCDYSADRRELERTLVPPALGKRVFTPSGDYEDQFGALVAQRLKMAGVRLGALLNRMLAD